MSLNKKETEAKFRNYSFGTGFRLHPGDARLFWDRLPDDCSLHGAARDYGG
jgi:hypothetical protein